MQDRKSWIKAQVTDFYQQRAEYSFHTVSIPFSMGTNPIICKLHNDTLSPNWRSSEMLQDLYASTCKSWPLPIHLLCIRFKILCKSVNRSGHLVVITHISLLLAKWFVLRSCFSSGNENVLPFCKWNSVKIYIKAKCFCNFWSSSWELTWLGYACRAFWITM